jgi:hypothetical protein
MTVRLYKLIVIWYNSGVVKTIWNLTFRKLRLSFICKTNSIHFNCYVSDVLILHFDCIKDRGVMLVLILLILILLCSFTG